MDFDAIERMISVVRPELVLHCGDLGIFDEGSWERLSARERKLILKHNNPMDQACAWTGGRRTLSRPMIAVPGNHEDFEIVVALEDGRRSIPGFRLLVAGARLRVPFGRGEITVMGLGRILDHPDDPSPMSPACRIRPSDIEALENSWDGVRPDVFLLHEPPEVVVGPRGPFGSPVISEVLSLYEPRLVVAGHMHFAWEQRWGSSRLIGLGYGARGHYAVLDESFQVFFRDFTQNAPPP
jgi:Icc-related predicted phosphoesterase